MRPPIPSIPEILRDSDLAPHKKLGQNFLVNPATVEAILDRAAPRPEDTIVEFGVGLGSLTIPLARRVARVIGLEIDSGLVAWHREHQILPDNVTLLHQDLLKADFTALAAQCGGRLKIIANLPYSISNPLLFRLVEHRDAMDFAVLMLQKEVAQRLAASPRTKEYGVLTVLLGACATVRPLLQVGPGQFHPRPKVDSTVIRLDFHPHPINPPVDFRLFAAIVKTAFQKRRKNLPNALAGLDRLASKSDLAPVLRAAGIEAGSRPDQLATAQYLALAQAMDRLVPQPATPSS